MSNPRLTVVPPHRLLGHRRVAWGRFQCRSRAERVTAGPEEDLTGLACLPGASAQARESQGKVSTLTSLPGAGPHGVAGEKVTSLGAVPTLDLSLQGHPGGGGRWGQGGEVASIKTQECLIKMRPHPNRGPHLWDNSLNPTLQASGLLDRLSSLHPVQGVKSRGHHT